MGGYHVILLIAGLPKPFNPTAVNLNLPYYPKISIIIPAKQEPILSRTIETCLYHIDYPFDKKELVVVTEDEDAARTAIWYQQKHPLNVKLLMRKRYFPTKPSALNDAVALCSGDIIGIVDVEDILERDILKKVAYAIVVHKYDVVQTILRISNPGDSWISRIFAMEYAGWFRIWLNARARLNLYVPLGGTGNYMSRSAVKEVGIWQPTQLAEDAEIAVRLMLSKKKICVIEGRQWEEAPFKFKAWLRQRTRWSRGWLQVLWKYLIIAVRPSMVRRIGIAKIFALIFTSIWPIVMLLNYPAYALTILWILEYTKILGSNLTSNLFPWFSIMPLFFNLLYYFMYYMGATIEEIKVRLKDIPLMIVYFNMIPLAVFRAVYQIIFKDLRWEKTQHVGRGVRWTYGEKININ